jgi:single-strand DNA-binding protein
MQRLEIIGFIGQDSVVKDLGQNQVINFSVAVSESYINKTTNEKITNTVWFECAKWGNNTQIAQFLKKGTQVFVSGKPTARSWQKEDGSLISVLGLNVNQIQLLGTKNENFSSTTNEPQQTTQQQPPTSQMTENPPNSEEHDDLPF